MLIHGTAGVAGGIGIAQEILQGPLAVSTQGLMQAHGMSTDDPQRARFLWRDPQNRGDLLDGWFAAELDGQLTADALDSCQHPDLMAWNSYRPSMVSQGAGNPLPNPPRCIGPKLEAQPMLVFVHGPHETAIAFLDEVG